MGPVLHGSARMTEAVRRATQRSEESVRALARRHGITPNTVQKWHKRASVSDAPMRPKAIHSTVPTIEDEATIVAFRRHTLLPPEDCLYALQPTIPYLTRSTLHRCLQRDGISRLPDVGGDKPAKLKFKAYPIGYFHIDIAEVRTEEGRLDLFVGIDRTSKFAFVQLHGQADRPTTASFLEALLKVVPYRLHTILTDNGTQFADQPRNRDGWTACYRIHRFDQICTENGIEHRLTKLNHPWTNGQVERMNRTIKDAAVKRYYYESHDQLRQHLQLFIGAYNYRRRLETLIGLTPFEYVARIWTEEPKRFKIDLYNHSAGLNI
jgi:Integrase core domain